MAILCMTFASCEKEEVGGTATQLSPVSGMLRWMQLMPIIM